MSSSVITIGGFLPGNSTAPITRSADLTSFFASSLPAIIVVILSWYVFFNSVKISLFKSIATTEAPIWIDLSIEALPTSPHPITTTFELLSSEIEDNNSPLPCEEYSKNCIPFWIARFPAILDIGIKRGYWFPSIIISVAIPVNFFSRSFFVIDKLDAKCKYPNKTCDGFKRSNSCSCGSLTLQIISDDSYNSSAEPNIFAPADS